jgi:predicted acylesterase/phospholipase RssA
MSGNIAPPDKFEKLGLSLSGGGVRAVGFHLGTLDVLERLNLLEKVEILSTASGGSLVGIGYALYQKIGNTFSPPKTFKIFFKEFFDVLPPLDTMEKLAEGMDEPSESGHRTMVGAMARIYRDAYFIPIYGDPKFEVFWQAEPQIHIKNMIFNATDFKTGLAFRFQYSDQNPGKIGNDQVYLEEDQAKELYMSDIMTTSACLPGLLEPMFIPQDYRLSDADRAGIRAHFNSNCDVEFDYVALMDGGMVDNQGISGILMTLLRNLENPPLLPPDLGSISPFEYSLRWRYRIGSPRARPIRPEGRPERQQKMTDTVDAAFSGGVGISALELAVSDLDLLIVSDTPVYMPPKKRYFPKKNIFASVQNALKDWFLDRTLNFYFLVWLFLFIAGVVSLALVIWGLVSVWLAATPGTGFFTAILDAIAASNFPGPLKIGLIAMVFVAIPIMLIHLAAWALAWFLARRMEDKLEEDFPSQDSENRPSLWEFVKGLTVRDVLHMLKLRLLSVLRLASEIFLNRVRQLSYRWLLEFEELESRVVPNEIFKLKVLNATTGQGSMTPRGPWPLPDWLESTTPGINDIVETASSMGTQIFLSEPAEDNLKTLAACGQVTTCFNLLEYLWQVHGDGNTGNNGEDAFSNNAAKNLFIATRTLWFQLKLDPYFYVDDRLS